MSKLDALLFQWTSMNRPESGSTGTAETVTVTVVCSGTRDLLTAAGLEIQHELAGIFTGNVRMSALPALEAVPEVLAIAAMIPEVPQTNESVPGIRAPSVWTGTPPRQGE